MERPDSRLIRVFLSSTFVDFQEERSLLVQQVFPSLRRRARSREVEIVDVDLRWGVTAEQTEQGETLPLCLGEIDRCRPYFISLLGERYGWVPPPDYYKPELLERQPWLKERMGGASVTELEILHGVLRNPEMAGHAFFYLRDPAYAQAQSEPGWVAESPSERERLAALKAQIRASGFPVEEGLPSPQAIAERIEADLWQLIESRFPEQEPADALEREDRRHSDYRRARTGLYLGGGPAIEQLERWITEGEQRILITGESGAGKSALIANWLEAHQRSHPQDLVHAHHLGCTNDASAVRPLLGRLIDTASKLLLQEQQISEPIKVPQDWWELVFKVGEVFALLSPWCERQGRRWILVLDGLDRLAEDDQQALPWIPSTIPPGIHVVASALDCPARTILHQRKYRTHEIGPLGKAEQQQLIERYLSRYTKQLESGLLQRILSHPLAGSPLFLRVLLEELRQCALFDTLQQQLEFYLSAESIDGLYTKVLERLEKNGHGDAARKALTALWASRAGLTEDELLAITGIAPLQWAPIDLALEKAFGWNGIRLIFDHDYLAKAVEHRYLPMEQLKPVAHSTLADWYGGKSDWDARKAEELPWQLLEARRLEELRSKLLKTEILAVLISERGVRETLGYLNAIRINGESDLDELIAGDVEDELCRRKGNPKDLVWFASRIADLLEEEGLYRGLLLHLRGELSRMAKASNGIQQEEALDNLLSLAYANRMIGDYGEAEILSRHCVQVCDEIMGTEHPLTLRAIDNLASLLQDKGDYSQAQILFTRCLRSRELLLGPEHPDALSTLCNLGVLYAYSGDYVEAEACYKRALKVEEQILGSQHPSTIATACNLGHLYLSRRDYDRAGCLLERCLEALTQLKGREHPSTLVVMNNLGALHWSQGNYRQAETLYKSALDAQERVLGIESPCTLTTLNNLGLLYADQGDFGKAEVVCKRCLSIREVRLGLDHPDTLSTVSNLAGLLKDRGDYEQAAFYFKRDLEARERLLGPDQPSTISSAYDLAEVLSALDCQAEAIPLRRRELAWCRQQNSEMNHDTLHSLNELAIDLRAIGELEESEALFRELLSARQQALEPRDSDNGRAMSGLAKTLEEAGKLDEALIYAQQAFDHRLKHEGANTWWTNRERIDLARILHKLARRGEALSHLNDLQASYSRLADSEESDRQLLAEAKALRQQIENAT